MDADRIFEFLKRRRGEILSRVERACERVGRETSEIEVVCISKTVDAPMVMLAQDAGWRSFGENRPQELVRKMAAIAEAGRAVPPFDMVGNLQTNKVNSLIGRVRRIQSISSLHLARAVSERAERQLQELPVLLEANVSGEASKSGFSPEELLRDAELVFSLPGILIEGLMTMAPAGDLVAARETFRGLRGLRNSLEQEMGVPLPTLSCGMSDDFEVAVEEGATVLRLGRVVFDEGYRFEG